MNKHQILRLVSFSILVLMASDRMWAQKASGNAGIPAFNSETEKSEWIRKNPEAYEKAIKGETGPAQPGIIGASGTFENPVKDPAFDKPDQSRKPAPVPPAGSKPVPGYEGVFVINNAPAPPDYVSLVKGYSHPAYLMGDWKLTDVRPVGKYGKEVSAPGLAESGKGKAELLTSGLGFELSADGKGNLYSVNGHLALLHGVSDGRLFVMFNDENCQSCSVPRGYIIRSFSADTLVLLLEGEDENDLVDFELTFTHNN